MSITVARRKRLFEGLFGRYFNTYFAGNMANLTSPTNSEVRTQFNSYSVGLSDTWLFRGFFLPDTTSSSWQFRTTSDDASYVWIGTDSTPVDTSLDDDDAVVDNGGLHGSQTRTSGQLTLNAGQFYPFAVVIGNNNGPGTLTLQFRVNGGQWQSNGTGFYFYNPFAPNGFNLE